MRDLVLDSAKGILILLVILGHALQLTQEDFASDATFSAIYSFHMPLFFVFAGLSHWYSCTRRTSDLVASISNKFTGLYRPYLIWSVIAVILLVTDNVDGNGIVNILANPFLTYWFLDVLFFLFVYVNLGEQLRQRRWLAGVFLAALIGADYALHTWLGWAHRTYFVLYYFPYFAIGYLIGRLGLRAKLDMTVPLGATGKWAYSGGWIALLIVASMGWGYGGTPNVIDEYLPEVGAVRQIAQYSYRFTVVLLAFMAFLTFAALFIASEVSALVVIGQTTLEIYVLHIFFMRPLGHLVTNPYALFITVLLVTVIVVVQLNAIFSKDARLRHVYAVVFGRIPQSMLKRLY